MAKMYYDDDANLDLLKEKTSCLVMEVRACPGSMPADGQIVVGIRKRLMKKPKPVESGGSRWVNSYDGCRGCSSCEHITYWFRIPYNP